MMFSNFGTFGRDNMMLVLHILLVWIYMGGNVPCSDPWLAITVVCIGITSLWTERYWYDPDFTTGD